MDIDVYLLIINTWKSIRDQEFYEEDNGLKISVTQDLNRYVRTAMTLLVIRPDRHAWHYILVGWVHLYGSKKVKT